MFCPNCGNSVADNQTICTSCGCSLQNNYGYPNEGYNTVPMYTGYVMADTRPVQKSGSNTPAIVTAVIATAIATGLVTALATHMYMNTSDSDNSSIGVYTENQAEEIVTSETVAQTTTQKTTTSATPSYNSYGVIDPSYYGATIGTAQEYHVNCTSVYLYKDAEATIKPSESKVAYENDNCEVYCYVGKCAYVSIFNGSDGRDYGWVPTEYLTAGSTSIDSDLYNWTKITVNVKSCNVNSSPAKDPSSRLGIAKSGDSFDVVSFDGYWFKVNYDGTYGYISYKMVTGES